MKKDIDVLLQEITNLEVEIRVTKERIQELLEELKEIKMKK
jgi:hypothetical protein